VIGIDFEIINQLGFAYTQLHPGNCGGNQEVLCKMVDIHRENDKANVERRGTPRLEFHCVAKVIGINDPVKITDISLGGFFFELKVKSKLKMGQIINVTISLPTEEDPIRVKARMINQTDRGVGCKFVDLTKEHKDAVHHCFETFKDTLPIT